MDKLQYVHLKERKILLIYFTPLPVEKAHELLVSKLAHIFDKRVSKSTLILVVVPVRKAQCHDCKFSS